MKILIACDCYVTPEMIDKIKDLEKYGNEVVVYDNKLLETKEAFAEYMLKTELEGAEAVEAGDEFVRLAEDADIIAVHLTPVNKKVIDNAKKLKLVAVMRGGVDSVNVDLLNKKGIIVTNAPWRSAFAVADFTVGMMISEVKNIAKSHHLLMEGKWEKEYPNDINYIDMRNRTIGLIGFGYIGQRVQQNLSGFGSKVIVHDPFMDDERVKQLGGNPVSLDELLSTSDIISLHLRYSEKTKNFIGRKEFAKMNEKATLINTARAGLVDQEAMIEALENKKILGAAVDVYHEEPLPKDNPYTKLDNITLTPHIAGVSNDTIANAVEIISEDLNRYFKNEEMKCVVR
ncbi:2-hydroxyacid dehydrogenase [uncultured Anaerofustis sp.]|uniref:2-hydroxyacid dehydrogenase n=1 Tax=uncultured Anaerofustis sp. TaxID=904996 RepID=UPI0025DC6EBD|nr:2-hydroxyacid dehydrogenase [uncultured Anaerofustis sp.]